MKKYNLELKATHAEWMSSSVVKVTFQILDLVKEPTYNTGRTGQHSIGPWWQDVLLPESREHLADADDGGLRGNPQCLTHLQ